MLLCQRAAGVSTAPPENPQCLDAFKIEIWAPVVLRFTCPILQLHVMRVAFSPINAKLK